MCEVYMKLSADVVLDIVSEVLIKSEIVSVIMLFFTSENQGYQETRGKTGIC